MIFDADVEKIFKAQLDKIKNEKLKDLVIKCWVEGCKRGGWQTLEALQKMPFTLLADCCGVSFIEHTIAVTEGAYGLYLAQKNTYKKMPYRIDEERLLAGGLLHDVGKLMETEPDGKGGYRKSKAGMFARHPISGAILAAEVGLSEEIVNIIACHAKEGEGAPQTPETVLIHLADYATFDPLVMKQKGTLIIQTNAG
jgi:putative nucleotidyltransferase with HDIG domain